MNLKKIKRAIISVSNKSNLNLILPILKKYKIEIISSGGTFKKIQSLKYKCIEISDYTEFKAMLDGRIKTLHPKIYAGILNIRKNPKHHKEIKNLNMPNIDLVIVDLYPFEKKIKDKIKFKKLIEYIDIGGSTLIRAAAKNYEDVTVISATSDYSRLIHELKNNNGATSIKFRELMSAKAFSITAYYDSIISNWLNEKLNIKFPEIKTIQGKLIEKLRYGENPHQKAGLYKGVGDLNFNKLNGKHLSYNNYNDIFSAISVINSFKKKVGTVIIKHANPCGVSAEKNQSLSYKKALQCDPVSAFGGVVAINSVISKNLAKELNKVFFEVILSFGFKRDALKILKKRKNLILIDISKFNLSAENHHLFLGNVFLTQEQDNILFEKKLKIVTKKKPSPNQLNTLMFAFNISKFVKSNAIVIANNKSTIGIGAGQPNRLESCRIAVENALKFSPNEMVDSVAASDAFFPFPDGIEELIDNGVKAIIQPGGSINDKKVIKAANDAGIAMVFTNTRHFKH